MKQYEGYKKKALTDAKILLAGGGDKSLGDFIGSLQWDDTNRKLQYKSVGATTWTDLVAFGSNAMSSTSYLPLTGGTITNGSSWAAINFSRTGVGSGTVGGIDSNGLYFMHQDSAGTSSIGMYLKAGSGLNLSGNVTANGFVKSNSSNNYVLLGGGGEMLLDALFYHKGYLYLNNNWDADNLSIGSWSFKGSGYGGVGSGAAHAHCLSENSIIEVFRNLLLSAIAWSDLLYYRVSWDRESNSNRPNGWGPWLTIARISDLPTKSSWNYDDMYVSTLGTSGDDITWTKNGTSNNLTVPYASYTSRFKSHGTSNWDANNLTYPIAENYGQSGGSSNYPGGYGSVFQILTNGGSSLGGQFFWSINHDSTSSTKDLYFRAGNNLGWQNDWKRIAWASDLNSYLPLSGGTITGDITMSTDNAIIWNRNTDSASISFKNSSNGDSDSYMHFLTSDDYNEYFRFTHRGYNNDVTEYFSIKSDGARVNGTLVSLNGHTHTYIPWMVDPVDYPTYTTVGDAKNRLALILGSQSTGIGYNVVAGASIIYLWDNNAASTYASSVYCITKIGGGYSGEWYGLWLVSGYSTQRVGILGRSGNDWSGLKWLSFTDDLNNYLPLSGGTMTGALWINGVADSGSYSQGGYDARYSNILLKGDSTYGVSGITFLSYKGTSNINAPSDVAFIQYHPYGVTASGYNTTPTEASSGEKSRLVIGIGNDNGIYDYGEELWLQTPGINDLKHYSVDGANIICSTIWDSGNDGTGSGLDADLLDGYHESSFFRIRDGVDSNSNADNISLLGGFLNATGNGSGNSNYPETYSDFFDFPIYYHTLFSCRSNFYWRTLVANPAGTTWRTLLDSYNYTSYVYDKTTSDGRYVLKSGDTMSGTLVITGELNWREGIRINNCSNGWTTLILGATGTSGTNENAWSLHTNGGTFYFANNGSSSFTNGLSWTKAGVLNITCSTSATFTCNTYAPNFYTTSDCSKKKNISSFSEHIRKFQLKDTEKWHYGVIAQEVPEMFRDGEEGSMTVNYNSVLSYYIGILENKIKQLEEKINILENK